MLRQLMAEDMAAYAAYDEARRLPNDAPDRPAAVAAASVAATSVPLEVIAVAASALDAINVLKEISNPNLASDLVGGALLAAACARVAELNVRVNLPQVDDAERREAIRSEAAAAMGRIDRLVEEITRPAPIPPLGGPPPAASTPE